MNKTVLIDGDVLLYKFGFRSEEKVEWANGAVSEWSTPDITEDEMDGFIEDLRTRAGCKHIIICLSGPSDTMFRYKIMSSYKHNRKDKEKPELYQHLKDYLIKNYHISSKPILEADDVMGILATKSPGQYVIATVDKDLAQVPGLYLNWNKTDKPVKISVEEADRFFYKQILTGDPVDGFSGIPGVGDKKAEKIINELYETGVPDEQLVWDRVLEEYMKKDLSESYALTQARMARILRFEDWDGENQCPIYWSPKY